MHFVCSALLVPFPLNFTSFTLEASQRIALLLQKPYPRWRTRTSQWLALTKLGTERDCCLSLQAWAGAELKAVKSAMSAMSAMGAMGGVTMSQPTGAGAGQWR